MELEYGLDLGSDQFAAWSALCAEIGEPEFVVAIAWVLANPVVSSAIVGVRTLRHLEGLDRAAELKLDADVMAKLDEIFDINVQRPLKMAAGAGGVCVVAITTDRFLVIDHGQIGCKAIVGHHIWIQCCAPPFRDWATNDSNLTKTGRPDPGMLNDVHSIF